MNMIRDIPNNDGYTERGGRRGPGVGRGPISPGSDPRKPVDSGPLVRLPFIQP